MILTGKCLEDFEKWLSNHKEVIIDDEGMEYDLYYIFMYLMNETAKNALIIDFFDSLKIYIFIDFINDEWYAILCGAEVSDTYFNSRLEATNEAIKRVNNIYNEVLFT